MRLRSITCRHWKPKHYYHQAGQNGASSSITCVSGLESTSLLLHGADAGEGAVVVFMLQPLFSQQLSSADGQLAHVECPKHSSLTATYLEPDDVVIAQQQHASMPDTTSCISAVAVILLLVLLLQPLLLAECALQDAVISNKHVGRHPHVKVLRCCPKLLQRHQYNDGRRQHKHTVNRKA